MLEDKKGFKSKKKVIWKTNCKKNKHKWNTKEFICLRNLTKMGIRHYYKVLFIGDLDIGIDPKMIKKRAFIILKMSKPD
jgi:hypothetical protein